MLAFIIPTRERHDELAVTLAAIGEMRLGRADAEVVVVDNASRVRPTVPRELANGVPVTLLCRGHNEGAAARTAGALEVRADRRWLVMLDDDSAPVEVPGAPPLPELLETQPADVGAVTAEIFLPRLGRREAGGLPEVPVGCGVAYRREAYLHAGGYDPLFNYYVEEYDLAAKLLLSGWRVAFERRWRVDHRKTDAQRDMDLILERLVRNNGWVMARYAPQSARGEMIAEVIERYGKIARKERATEGYRRGLIQLQRTIEDQPRDEMPAEIWDRFTGLAAARSAVAEALAVRGFGSAAVVQPGKNAWAVRRALEDAGVEIGEGVAGPRDVLLVGTMSPGPMLDAGEMLEPLGRRVVLPWTGAWRSAAARSARSVVVRNLGMTARTGAA
jgi:GT2 family glycosyltransferase